MKVKIPKEGRKTSIFSLFIYFNDTFTVMYTNSDDTGWLERRERILSAVSAMGRLAVKKRRHSVHGTSTMDVKKNYPFQDISIAVQDYFWGLI